MVSYSVIRVQQFINKQCTCITLYNCTVYSTTRYRAQLARRQQRERTSSESEMLTYEHVNEVVRNICVKHEAKRWDSRATFLLIATSFGALIILTRHKQLQILLIKQTN